MAAWSEVTLSELAHGYRIDSEFYKQEYLDKDLILNKLGHKAVGLLGKVTDGEHGSVKFLEDGVKYLTAENIKNGYVDIDKIRYVSQAVDDRNARARVNVNDILVSIKGTLGQIAIVEEGLLPANMNRDVAIIKLYTSELNKIFTALFLQTKYGLYQLEREGSGGVQQMITLGRLREVKIPYIDEEFQRKYADVYLRSLSLKQISKSLYNQAQEILEKELEMDKLVINQKIYSMSSFASVSKSHRLDSQHFQSKFTDLIKHLSKFPCEGIKSIKIYNRRGIQPSYIDDGVIDVVNSQHISRMHLKYDALQKTSEKAFHKHPEAHIQENDLLIYTTGAYIGQTNVYLQATPALASNHVNILRIRPEIDSVYMGMVFQSKIGKYQTEMHSRGSAQAELYPTDIDKFIVPILPLETQRKIAELVRNSLIAENESKQLLEQAKKRVEELIEGVIEQ